MERKPLVSVLMPVYNAAAHIAEALTSLLRQDYSELEIIIVDDACSDHTMEIVDRLKDRRVRILTNDQNMGLAASLNKAIRSAAGDYLARMDADDIAHPSRISRQVAFLSENPQVDVLGTAMQYFGASRYLNYFPETHAACKAQLLFNVCFGHPSVMIRKRVFDDDHNLYNPELRQYSEEYDLWCRLVDRFSFYNLQEVLLYYRTYAGQVKKEALGKRLINAQRIRTNFLLTHLGKLEPQYIALHNEVTLMQRRLSGAELREVNNWFNKIISINQQIGSFQQNALQDQLARCFFEICYHNTRLGQSGFWYYYNSDWRKFYHLPARQWLKFAFKQFIWK